MNNDFLFFLSFGAVVLAGFIIGFECDFIPWLFSIFLLIVFVPLLIYATIKDFRNP